MKAIADSIKFCNTLRNFGLSWGTITQNTADSIATIIESNREIQTLYLFGNCLFNTERISQAICNLSNLGYIEMNSSLVVEDLTCKLPNSVCDCEKLHTVKLNNYSLSMSGEMNLHTPLKNIKSVMLIKVYTIKNNLAVFATSKGNNICVNWSQDDALASTGLLRIVSAFKNITSITLCNNTACRYSDQDVDEIALMLANFTTLKTFFSMKNCLNTTTSLHYVLISLSKSTELQEINLFGGKVQDKAVESMAAVLNNNKKLIIYHCSLDSRNIMAPLKNLSTIRKLSLCSNSITDGAASDISDAISVNTTMEELEIGENMLQTKGMIKILHGLSQLKSLKTLSISGNNVTEDISSYIACVIATNTNLVSLDLEGMSVHIDGVKTILNAMKSLKSLTFLDISKNNINKDVAESDNFMTVITKNTCLNTLRMSENNLGMGGLTKLTTALLELKEIKQLNLINTGITYKSAEKLAEAIKRHHSLQSLLLGEECLDTYNEVGSTTFKDVGLEHLFIKSKIQKDKKLAKLSGPECYNVVKATNEFNVVGICKICIKTIELQKLIPTVNCSVCLLKLIHNELQSHGTVMIAKALSTIKSLEILSIENNKIDDLAADDLANAISDNTGIKQLWIGENSFKSTGISTILQSLIKASKVSLEIIDLSYISLFKTVNEISAGSVIEES